MPSQSCPQPIGSPHQLLPGKQSSPSAQHPRVAALEEGAAGWGLVTPERVAAGGSKPGRRKLRRSL